MLNFWNCYRSDKYDLNYTNAIPLMPTSFSSLFKIILWSMVSNAVLRSSNTNREVQPRLDDKSKTFVTLMRAVSVLWSKSRLKILANTNFFLKRRIVVTTVTVEVWRISLSALYHFSSVPHKDEAAVSIRTFSERNAFMRWGSDIKH